MLEFLANWILGRRLLSHPDLPEGSIPPDVILRVGKLIPRIGGAFSRMKGPAAAVTLGRTIVVDPAARLTPALLAHELVHVRQWKEDRLFPIRYAVAAARYGYRNNPYEVEARSLASTERPIQGGPERT